MRKSFRMFLTLALSVLCVLGVNAQERISLQEVEYYSFEGWGPDAKKIGTVTPAWELGVPSGCPYGDTNVNNGADLSAFSKLIITVSPESAGMRVMMNRKIEEGNCADTEEASNLISIPSHAWCTQKYCTIEGNTYIIDLAKILKDQGFVRLHAIKGASWNSQATIESIEVERAAVVKQVGWTQITTNADLEGDDMSSYAVKVAPSTAIIAPMTEGVVAEGVTIDSVGVNGGKGLKIASPAMVSNPWDSQFWIVLPQPLLEGTKYRVFFDYKANIETKVDAQTHKTPGNYLGGFATLDFTTEWQSYESGELVSVADLQSIAFNLSMTSDAEFYFDNIRFEEYKYGVSAAFCDYVIQLDFGFDTNLPDLVKASGRPRLMYPNDCVTLKINGEDAEIQSVEGYADGRFYVYVSNINSDDVVTMTFKNPADEAYHLVYNGGPGGDVKDFDGEAVYDFEVANRDDVYSYVYENPTLISAEPESGSFNLPNSIREFKVTFDKSANAEQIKATLNGEALTVEPATGLAESFTFTRPGTEDLASGAYELRIFDIWPEEVIFDEPVDTIITLNVGKVVLDPADTVRYILETKYFDECGENYIPMGYTIYYGTAEEVRAGGSSWGSGARMFNFAAGGDFTKGLYLREGRIEYGHEEGYKLDFEAGKSYNIHFNTAMWQANGTHIWFEIYNELEEVVYSQLIANTPNVSQSKNAVHNSTSVDIKFTASTTGNYCMKWWSSNGNGDFGTVYSEVLLANVSVKYIPNAAGVEETQLVVNALANAKNVENGNTDAKYEGVAFNALKETIAKYEAEYETYTAPSKYYEAAAALDAAVKAMNDHRALCDTYYALPEKAQNILDNNANKKFSKTALYAELAVIAPKYVTKTVTKEEQEDPETGEVTEVEVVTIDVKKITDDVELQAAIDELQVLVNTTEKLFTEGASKVTTTGIAALVERFRLAADALVSLGVPATDDLVVAAKNALDDDDELAEKIKNRMKLEIFGQLKNADNKLFEAVLDTNIMDYITPTYDLTVFVKNPNLYATGITYNAANQLQSGWEVPGWSTPDTLQGPDLTTGWGSATYEIFDCMFQTWKRAYCVEQTIVDLPAGVYNVVGGFGEREAVIDGTYFYARTSETPANEIGTDTIHAPLIGQVFPVDNLTIPNVVVADGMLTMGVVAPANSTTFFNQVKLYMAGSVEGFDYASAYQEIANGVEENIVAPAQVLGIELYDLNGRRIAKAQQGVVIMRKFMSDGTIKVEKIIKK